MEKIKADIHNEFTIHVDDIKTGEHKEYKAKNIILNAMYTRLCAFSTYFDYIHFGTGTGTFDDPTRTSLYTHLGTKSATEESKTAAYPTSQWRKKIVLNPEEYVGSTISEIGVAYGSSTSNLVTHAAPKDSEGNPIGIGPKLATQIVTIYADIFVTLYSPDYGLYFYDNGLRNYLLGGSISSNYIDISFNATDPPDTNNYDMASKSCTCVADTANKKVTSYARFQAEDYSKDIRYIDWRTMGIRCELPRPGVFTGIARTGVNLGVGDGEQTVFPIQNKNVTISKVYVNGDEQTSGWAVNSVGAIEFTTAPDSGLAVTADYTCPYVPKDTDHVFDVTWTLQYAAGEPPAVVSHPGYAMLPGEADPVKGTTTRGFFGEVSAEDLISGGDLCDMLGITDGTLINSDIGWLKFARDSKQLFVAKRAIRHSISWNHINDKGAVYGDAAITIGGVKYAVRLLSTTEWSSLIVRVHTTGAWGIYTDTELLVASGDGRYTWTSTANGSYRVSRGGSSVSYSSYYNPSIAYAYCGFRPVLEPLLLPATL